MTKSKKILVTGGTGFIGSSLVKTLLKNKYQVRVFDNDFRGSIKRLNDVKKQVDFVRGDIRDSEKVAKAVKGVECVVHLAFINGTGLFYSIPEIVLDVGVRGTINVIDACVKQNIRDFFFASSSEVYQTPPTIPTPEDAPLMIPDPLNPRYSYAGGKIIGELLTTNYGRKYFKRAIIFRPHNVYGPDMGWEHVIPHFVLRMKELAVKKKKGIINFPIQGTGSETRSFCYIEDFTDGLMRVIEKGKHLQIYNIGTDKETTVADLARKVGNYFGRKIMIVPGEIQKGTTLRRCPDITKLRRLDYEPKVLLEHGLKITAKWYDMNAHLKLAKDNNEKSI